MSLIKYSFWAAGIGMLAACSGNPDACVGGVAGSCVTNPDDPDAPVEVIINGGVNASSADGINAVSFKDAPEVIDVTNAGFDGFQKFTRDSSLDRNGYLAYRNPEGQRDYMALYKQSDNGRLETLSVATGQYEDTGDYILYVERTAGATPTSGYADYTGTYAGFLVGKANDTGPLLAADGVGSLNGGAIDYLPRSIAPVTGDAVLQLDFEDAYVEGDIRNLTSGNTDIDEAYLPLFLPPLNRGFLLNRGTLAESGVFEGTVVLKDTNYTSSTYQVIVSDDDAAGWIYIEAPNNYLLGTVVTTCDPAYPGTQC